MTLNIISKICLHNNENTQDIENRWSSLSDDQKTVELMHQLYLRQNNFNHTQALIYLKKDIDYFLNIWDKDQCNRMMKIWWTLTDKIRQDQIKMGLIYLAIKFHLDNNDTSSYQASLDYAVSLTKIGNPDLFAFEFLEKLRLYKLRENLEWVNIKRISYLKNQPLNLLKMVVLHNKHVFPKENFLTDSRVDINKFPLESIRSLDEAALLWNLLNFSNLLNSTDLIRNHYFMPLAVAYKKQIIVDQIIHLFEIPISFENSTGIYFDGFAFQNASGKTIYDLIKLPKVQKILFSLDSLDKFNYVEDALEQIGESSQYTIGSLYYSLACSLARIFHYKYHRKLPPFFNEQQLIEQFSYLENRWKIKKDYPINPRVLLAMHLAKSNDVINNGTTWQERTYFLLNYLDKEFKTVLGYEQLESSILQFNRRQAAFFILKKLGFSEKEITEARCYKILKERRNCQKVSPIDRFLKIAEINKFNFKTYNSYRLYPTLLTAYFSVDPILFPFQGKNIDPMVELDKAEIDFNNRLLNDPWLIEETKENLERRETEVSEKNIRIEIKRLMENIKAQQRDLSSNTDLHNSWVYWLPIIGSMEVMADGIKDKVLGELLLGTFLLSLEAFGCYPFIRLFLNRAIISLLSRGEKIAIHSLRVLKNELNLPELIENNIRIKESSYFNIDISGIPEGYEGTIEAVRQGSKDKVWHDTQGKEYLLIYLSDADKVIPVKSKGGYYQQVDWWSGKELRHTPLIYRDKNTGKYTMAALKGGARETLEEALTVTEIEKFYTVKEIKILFERITDYSIRENFSDLFNKYFLVQGIDEFNPVTFYYEAYQKSPIFRGLFNYFFDSIENNALKDVNHYEIFIQESSTGSHFNFEINKIIVDDRPLVNYFIDPFYKNRYKYLGDNYLSGSNKGIIAEIEALHEMLHALTKVDDLFLAKFDVIKKLAEEVGIELDDLRVARNEFEQRAASDEKSALFLQKLDNTLNEIYEKEQGAIVWLTDNIMLSISKKFVLSYPRLAYATVESEELETQVAAITNYLDKKLDQHMEISMTRNEFIGGENVRHRKTVKAIKNFFEKISSEHVYREILPKGLTKYRDIFDKVFLKYFSMDEILKNFFWKIYQKSPLFRKIFDLCVKFKRTFPSSPVELSEIEITDPRLLTEIAYKKGSGIHYLNNDIRYLSIQGLMPIEKKQLAMYSVLGELMDSDAFNLMEQASTAIREGRLYQLGELVLQRSELHIIADQIFKEAEINYPKCLSSVFVVSGDEFLEKELLRHRIQLSRIVAIEDRLIAEDVFYPKIGNSEQSLPEAHSSRMLSEKAQKRHRRELPTMTTDLSRIGDGHVNAYLSLGSQPDTSNSSNIFYIFTTGSTINNWLLMLDFFIRRRFTQNHQNSIDQFSVYYKYQKNLDSIEISFTEAMKKFYMTY